ncbi:histidine phosphatase family protein [Nonomuraea wenchangensis]
MRRRAVQTVEIACVGVEKEIRVDRRLRGCGYGVCNGRPMAEVAALRGRYVECRGRVSRAVGTWWRA